MDDETLPLTSPDQEPDAAAADEELSAFDLPAAPAAPLDVRNIPLGDIQQLENIRPHFHGIEGLAATMHVSGQLQAVVVRPAAPDAAHDRPFELVFGYRRYLAAESMGWDTIRAEVRDVADDNKRRQLIIENFSRENLSAVGEARALYELKYASDPPLSNAEVARQMGCDPSHVSHRLKMLLGLAPPKPAPAPVAAPAPTADTADSGETDADGGDELPRPEHNQALPSQHVPVRDAGGALVMPGSSPQPASADTATDDADGPADAAQPEFLDILALVDDGQISASTAEVIASLPERDLQEHLTKLVLKFGWGVKKTAQWVRQNQREDLSEASNSEALGPVEMLAAEDVVALQTLRVREDLSSIDIDRITTYALLRNGMDNETLDYITERLGYTYETLWDYVAILDDDQLAELKGRLAVRYISAAHRFFDLEPGLKDHFAAPPAPEQQDGDEQLAVGAAPDLPRMGSGAELDQLPMPSAQTLAALALGDPDA